MAETQQTISNGRDGVPPSAVGTLLRQARERNGLSLAAASQQLRIREHYLRAIEEGNFRVLPGTTYAVGFLRSYADHLGLDPQEVVRRFREEVEELSRRTQLVFPSAPAEGKIPGGAILMIAAVIAFVGYGGWYFLSERDTSVADVAPSLPASQETADSAGAVKVSAGEPVAATAELDAAVGQAVAAAAPTTTGAEAAMPSATAAADSFAAGSTATVPNEEGPAVDAPEDADLVPETPSDVPLPEPAVEGATAAANEAQPATGASATEISSPSDGAGEAQVASTTDAIPPSPSLPNRTEDLPQGQQYGVTNTDARVVLVATQDSWVQIKNAEGDVVWTKILKEGDRYLVPNEAGLSLDTGNAGGLHVLVDGRPMAMLGPVGVVRRGILLDPQRLIDGTAVP